MLRRAFSWLVSHRWIGSALALVVVGVLGSFAAKVRPNYRVEDLFPVWDTSRTTYDRFKTYFPQEDNRALAIVEADDLFTHEGLTRLGALEEAFRATPDVLEVEGPLSMNDVTAQDDWVQVAPLFPSADLPADQLAARREIATHDPLFAWSLARPDGKAVTIRVTLTPAAGADEGARDRFRAAAEKIVAAHAHPGQKIVLSGIPVIRAEYVELLQKNAARLVPAALLIVLVLLFFAFRSVGAILSALLTIIVSLVGAYGVMGILGYSMNVVGSVMPIVVIIISVSDTVHVVSDFMARRLEGESVKDALVHAMVETAVPCLLTEVVLACGFLSLLAINIRAVNEFGIASALSMLLTWLANVTVLPLALSFTRGKGRVGASEAVAASPAQATWPVRKFAAFTDWIIDVVLRRPRRVLLVAAVILAAAALAGTQVKKISYAFDDLKPSLPLYQELRFAEGATGGLVPVAIFIEAGAEDGSALDPEFIRVAERGATLLETFPEIKQAASLADPLRKAHKALAGGDPQLLGDGLPATRALVSQELALIDDGKLLKDLISFDRRGLVALGYARDVGSPRVREIMSQVDTWVAAEQARLGARATIRVTGQLEIFRRIDHMLVQGMVGSLFGAFLATILVFTIVLRSWRLGVIGLVPNVAPLLLVLGMMWLADIPLKPVTVMAFSITLVIADDDTIQFLSRFRGHYRRAMARRTQEPGLDVHEAATIACMRDVGLPMFLTSSSVSAGFLILALSDLSGTMQLGLIIGTTLFAAVFADMFLTPLMLLKLRPTFKTSPGDGDAD